jgi:PPK2 family polyphosphate:nucleotide phosphotransferase
MKRGLIPKPGSRVKLADYDPDDTRGDEQESVKAEKEALEGRLEALQERLYAEGKHALLVVLQAMDGGGKDGTIRKVFDAVNPQGVRVVSFKQPSSEELAHDFLWRVHQQVPPKGYIGIFNRSHYEDVLVVRVNNLVPKRIWEKRYDQINHFEQSLAENGTRILKFFLHISKHEQKQRFQARLDEPEKHWKFSVGDLTVRQQWDDYMSAYEAVLSRCNTEYAPWHIVPANHKWYRNLVISRAIVNTLEDINPQYPAAESGLDQIVIPD